MNISEFRSQVTMKLYGDVQDATYGGLTRTLSDTVEIWAKVEQIGGSTNPNKGQVQSDDSITVTTYYNEDFTTAWVLEFEGNEYKINYIKTDNVAYKRFMIIDAVISLNLSA